MKKTLIGGMTAAIAALGITLAAPANADFVFDICGSGMDGVVAGTPTSCPFADNVRAAYFQSGGPIVQAWSPVMERYYVMDCSYRNFIARLAYGGSHPGVLCTGGNDAAVVLW